MYPLMRRPSFSVVIPTRNRHAFARRAVECALAQEGVEVEVLLVDDGSSDGSRDHLAALSDPRVRLFDGPGAGPCAARNVALEHVRSPWIAFLDDDDLWAPGKLVRLAETGDAAGFGFSSAIVIDQDGQPMRLDAAPDLEDLELQLLRRNAIGTPSVVVARTDLVLDLGGFDERLPVLGDWELWLRLAAVTPAFATSEPLTAYTVHTRSISVREAGALDDELRYLVDKHSAHYRRSGEQVDMDWFTQWNAENMIRRGQRFAAAGSFLRHAGRGRSVRSLLRAGRLLLGEGISSTLRPPAPPPGRPAWLGSYYSTPAAD
jgi:glycosyltransferase involved in cell wall biosynthesis